MELKQDDNTRRTVLAAGSIERGKPCESTGSTQPRTFSSSSGCDWAFSRPEVVLNCEGIYY